MNSVGASRKFSGAMRRRVEVASESLVKASLIEGAGETPLLITPQMENVDLAGWVEANRQYIDEKLHHHGAILFRGFDLSDEADFSRVMQATGCQLSDYVEKATPRSRVKSHIYTSTEFPQEFKIAQHNELSYVKPWPMRIYLFAEHSPSIGGETPVADVRKVLSYIDPEIREKFERLGWRLVRNYGFGFGPEWRAAFCVESRKEAEAYFNKSDIQFQWLGDDRLRTEHIRPVTRAHPVTGDKVWFNHVAFWHLSSLPDEIRQRFMVDFGEEGCPYNTFYGDGSVIEDEVAAHLRAAYDKAEVSFKWQNGDLIMADNMLVSHGRNPYQGERRILVTMGDLFNPDIN